MGSSRDGDLVELTFPAGERFHSIGRLVVGGLASRFELPVDRVDDLVLAIETLVIGDIAGEAVTIAAVAEASALSVTIGPFVRDTTADDAVVRLLRPLVDSVTKGTKNGGGNWVELVMGSRQISESGG
jgi:hypothetical protein